MMQETQMLSIFSGEPARPLVMNGPGLTEYSLSRGGARTQILPCQWCQQVQAE